MENIRKYLEAKIGEGETGYVINILEELLQELNEKLYQDLLLIKSGFSDLKENLRKGLIEDKDNQREKNKINQRILDLLKEIKAVDKIIHQKSGPTTRSDATIQEPIQFSLVKPKNLLWILGGIFILYFGLIILLNQLNTGVEDTWRIFKVELQQASSVNSSIDNSNESIKPLGIVILILIIFGSIDTYRDRKDFIQANSNYSDKTKLIYFGWWMLLITWGLFIVSILIYNEIHNNGTDGYVWNIKVSSWENYIVPIAYFFLASRAMFLFYIFSIFDVKEHLSHRMNNRIVLALTVGFIVLSIQLLFRSYHQFFTSGLLHVSWLLCATVLISPAMFFLGKSGSRAFVPHIKRGNLFLLYIFAGLSICWGLYFFYGLANIGSIILGCSFVEIPFYFQFKKLAHNKNPREGISGYFARYENEGLEIQQS